MGSVVRYSNLDAFEIKFGQKIRDYYKPLIGLTVESIGDTEADYYIAADVGLSDGKVVATHFRWAREEEEIGEEIRELPVDVLYSEYFNEHIKGRVITEIQTGYERDDEFYAYIFVEGGGNIEIPVYFDPECLELGGCVIISPDEFEEFRQERMSR